MKFFKFTHTAGRYVSHGLITFSIIEEKESICQLWASERGISTHWAEDSDSLYIPDIILIKIRDNKKEFTVSGIFSVVIRKGKIDFEYNP